METTEEKLHQLERDVLMMIGLLQPGRDERTRTPSDFSTERPGPGLPTMTPEQVVAYLVRRKMIRPIPPIGPLSVGGDMDEDFGIPLKDPIGAISHPRPKTSQLLTQQDLPPESPDWNGGAA